MPLSRTARFLLGIFIVSLPISCWAVELGVALTASHFLAFTLLAFAGWIWIRHRPSLPLDAAVLSLAAFVLVAAASVVQVQLAPDISILGESAHIKSVKQLAGLVFSVGVFVALYCILRWYGAARYALRVHYWTTVAVALLALVQYAIAVVDMHSPLANFENQNSTLGTTRVLSLMYGFPRVSLTMVEPSFLAVYLLTGWAYWVAIIDRPRAVSTIRDWWFAASGLFAGAMAIVAGSRRGYVVFAALAIAALALRPNRLFRAGAIVASVGLGVLLTGPVQVRGIVASLVPDRPVVSTPVAPRSDTGAPGAVASARDAKPPAPLTTMLDGSVQQRAASFLIAYQVLRDRPILGSGWGTSSFFMELYWPSYYAPLPQARMAPATMLSHYSAIATETGLLGTFTIGIFSIVVLWRLVKAGRQGSPADRVVVIGAAFALASYAIGAVSGALVTYQVLLVWLLLAVALSLDREATPKSSTIRIGS